MNDGTNLKKQVFVFLNLVHKREGKVILPVQAKNAVKVEIVQFADNTQQDEDEFSM